MKQTNLTEAEKMTKAIAREKLCRQMAATQRGGFKANYTKEANRLAQWIAKNKQS